MRTAQERGRGFLVERPAPCSPDVMFESIADDPYSFLLDSALEDPRLGRHAFLGSRPFLVLSSRGRRYTVREGPGLRVTRRGWGDPLVELRRIMAVYRLETPAGAPPLLAGAVGYASYEVGRLFDPPRIAPRASRTPGAPELCFGLYESVLAYDLARGTVCVQATGLAGPKRTTAAAQRTRAQRWLAELDRARSSAAPRPRRPFRLTRPLVPDVSRREYEEAVESVRDFISRGEIYQANFTQRFESRWTGDPYDLYRRLRRKSPAPFSAYLNFGPVRVCSSSPERLLHVSGGRVQTRPIKGTRPRGATPQADREAALELIKSRKDAAEHVMIVDLERNDLGRICEPGSVRVPELAALEVFPQVFHLTSTVEGRLKRGLTAADALRGIFPGGSITGAPKIRAQEVLAGLEPTARGVYTGALGYLSFAGRCDFSIAIRTLTLVRGRVSFGVGGGVVIDSDPAAEYEESLHKARGMLEALEPAPSGSPVPGVRAP